MLLEKSFFDTDENETEFATTEELGSEPSKILQIKFLWSTLNHLLRITNNLKSIDKKFESVYEKLETLYRTFSDFIIHYENIEPEKREEFLKLYREEFFRTIQELRMKLRS